MEISDWGKTACTARSGLVTTQVSSQIQQRQVPKEDNSPSGMRRRARPRAIGTLLALPWVWMA